MGHPMAGHLATAGYQVSVYNRTTAKAEQWVKQYQGCLGLTPREAAQGADLVFVCVGNDDDLRSVIYGNQGALAAMAPGSLLVDLGARRTIKKKGAENGALTVMMGGNTADFERAQPVILSYARAATLLGPVGSGQLTKMVNQICIAGIVQGLSEGLNFAQKAGLDGAKVVDVISKGAAQSWQMENRGLTMLKDEFDFGFAVNWMRKDLAICLDECRHNGARLPMTALVDQFYAEIQALDGGRWDTSSLIRLLNGYTKKV